MKQGKVFDKLIARKNVQGIEFADKTCTVTLTDGRSAVCKTAHEARLFIEGKADAPKAPAPAPVTAAAKCGTEAPQTTERTCRVSRDWLIEYAGTDFGINAPFARVTVSAMAAIIAGGHA